MAVQDDLRNRAREAREEGTVSGRMLAIICEQAMGRMTKDQINSEIEDQDD